MKIVNLFNLVDLLINITELKLLYLRREYYLNKKFRRVI